MQRSDDLGLDTSSVFSVYLTHRPRICTASLHTRQRRIKMLGSVRLTLQFRSWQGNTGQTPQQLGQTSLLQVVHLRKVGSSIPLSTNMFIAWTSLQAVDLSLGNEALSLTARVAPEYTQHGLLQRAQFWTSGQMVQRRFFDFQTRLCSGCWRQKPLLVVPSKYCTTVPVKRRSVFVCTAVNVSWGL